jgi:GntR family transcriptional regulator, colanic acid and biofilm gene transcriptional regulator
MGDDRLQVSGLGIETLPERGPSLATQVYQRLKMKFLLGEMLPGRRFAYREIAQELGISVTPAREAIFKLIAEQIFEPGPAGVISVPKLNAAVCRQLWHLRLLLEGECAELAAPHVDRATIEILNETHQLMMAAKHARDLPLSLKYNLKFHQILYGKSNMPIMVSMIETLLARSTAYISFFQSHHVEHRGDTSVPGPHVHATVVSALRSGNAAGVRRGIERDIIEIRESILSLLGSTDSSHDSLSGRKDKTAVNLHVSSRKLRA